MAKVNWQLKRTYYGWEGTIEVPPTLLQLPGGRTKKVQLLSTGRATTKAGAVKQAAGMLESLTDNPLVSAALGPQGAAAAQAMAKIADAAGAGKAVKAVGKGAKRLAKALKFW